MAAQRLVVALTVANIVVLVLTAAQLVGPAFAQTEAPVLRGRALEIVDEQGRVRASINVLPAGRSNRRRLSRDRPASPHYGKRTPIRQDRQRRTGVRPELRRTYGHEGHVRHT